MTGVKWFLFLYLSIINDHAVSCAGSVVLTQTNPPAPYVCRTGNIILRCQYDGVENVLGVLWIIGSEVTSNASTIPGHTGLPRTTTYQEVVVDSYTGVTWQQGIVVSLHSAMGHNCRATYISLRRSVSATYLNILWVIVTCHPHSSMFPTAS